MPSLLPQYTDVRPNSILNNVERNSHKVQSFYTRSSGNTDQERRCFRHERVQCFSNRSPIRCASAAGLHGSLSVPHSEPVLYHIQLLQQYFQFLQDMQSSDNISVAFTPPLPPTNTPPTCPCLCPSSQIATLDPLRYVELTNASHEVQMEQRKSRPSKLGFREVDEV